MCALTTTTLNPFAVAFLPSPLPRACLLCPISPPPPLLQGICCSPFSSPFGCSLCLLKQSLFYQYSRKRTVEQSRTEAFGSSQVSRTENSQQTVLSSLCLCQAQAEAACQTRKPARGGTVCALTKLILAASCECAHLYVCVPACRRTCWSASDH